MPPMKPTRTINTQGAQKVGVLIQTQTSTFNPPQTFKYLYIFYLNSASSCSKYSFLDLFLK